MSYAEKMKAILSKDKENVEDTIKESIEEIQSGINVRITDLECKKAKKLDQLRILKKEENKSIYKVVTAENFDTFLADIETSSTRVEAVESEITKIEKSITKLKETLAKILG